MRGIENPTNLYYLSSRKSAMYSMQLKELAYSGQGKRKKASDFTDPESTASEEA